MQIVDPVILDPADFLPGGAELDLSGAGFRVLDANFGEADVELELQRQAIGEVPTTYHPPNTTTVLALGVREEGDVDLPTAAHQLAQKVGEINSPGTEHWLKREFEVGGNFAGALGKRVYKATLSGLGSWQRGESPDVVLTLVTGPYWYATVEQESALFESEEGARELIFELAEVLGTSPGLIRIRIDNLGEEHWRALILAGECRDHPQDETADTTAALSYDAADLTLKGGSTDIGGGIVENDELTAGWLSILGSEITAEELGHMTHRGVRRPWIRAEDPNDNDDVQFRLRWRELGSLKWSENRIVLLNIHADYQLYDLGECRPGPAALGDQRWEFDLQARAVSGAGKVRLHRVEVLPTEQYMVVKSPELSQAADKQSQKSPGTVVSEEAEGSGKEVWTGFSNVKASDDSRATVALPGGVDNASEHLKATEFGNALPEGASIEQVIVEAEVSVTLDGEGHVQSGVYLWGPSGVLSAPILTATWPSPGEDETYVSASFSGSGLTSAIVNSALFGASVVAFTTAGEAGARVDHIRITVYYTEAADENRICFAGRGCEPRTDGIFRQHPEDDVWGELLPEGFLPFASPSGLEGRQSRYIVIPSQGDFGELADSGENPLSAQASVRPAYLFAREAA